MKNELEVTYEVLTTTGEVLTSTLPSINQFKQIGFKLKEAEELYEDSLPFNILTLLTRPHCNKDDLIVKGSDDSSMEVFTYGLDTAYPMIRFIKHHPYTVDSCTYHTQEVLTIDLISGITQDDIITLSKFLSTSILGNAIEVVKGVTYLLQYNDGSVKLFNRITNDLSIVTKEFKGVSKYIFELY